MRPAYRAHSGEKRSCGFGACTKRGPMKSFSQRLAICLERGRMAQGDLRWWFGRSYSTTASWLKDDREPRGPAGDEARRRLSLLEKGIASNRGFPVPVHLS